MKIKSITIFYTILNLYNIAIPSAGIDPNEPIIYPPHYPAVNPKTPHFNPQAPGFNAPDKDPKFNGVKPIPFKPEDLSTGTRYGSDKNMIGYFWNTKDDDPSIIYPGKARIGNDQFINVVIVDSKKVDTTGQEDDFAYTHIENIYNLNSKQNKNFQSDFLVKIGTIIRNGITYDLYGQYQSTVIPDSESVQTPVFVDVKN